MNIAKISINAVINADAAKAWDYYTNPIHIVNWNFADPSWHCPSAENDMRVGGIYNARMEAKDGSFSFDFKGIYTEVADGEHFTFELAERAVNVMFTDLGSQTEVTVTFDPENENDIEMQKAGWQAILNNYKTYTETN